MGTPYFSLQTGLQPQSAWRLPAAAVRPTRVRSQARLAVEALRAELKALPMAELKSRAEQVRLAAISRSRAALSFRASAALSFRDSAALSFRASTAFLSCLHRLSHCPLSVPPPPSLG